MSWTIYLASAMGVLGFLYMYVLQNKKQKKGKQAPHVGRFPIIGSLFHMKDPMSKTMLEEYPGQPVVQVDLGMKPTYYLNTAEAVKEAFVEKADNFSGRPEMTTSKHIFGDAQGIVFSEGEPWKEYRRFSLQTLRDFGFGRKGAEEIIDFEAENLVKVIEGQLGKPMELSFQMSVSVSNVICQLVFGSRLASDDPEFENMAQVFRNFTQNEDGMMFQFIIVASEGLLQRLPWLASLVLKLKPAQKAFADLKTMFDYCMKQITEHKKLMDDNAESKDYIEAHLKHQKGKEKMFTDARLTMAIRDLFLAGTDTTSNTLRFAFLAMVAFPDVAENVAEEIQSEIGSSRSPQMSDKSRMHYVNATIEEINRMASLAPEGVAHRTTNSDTVAGFHIEADALVKSNIYAIHYDPVAFPDPHKMKPERHLTADGTFKPHSNVIPFSVGRRACLGESLARMELFLFFTSVMQRFTVELAPGQDDAEMILKDTKMYTSGVRAAKKHEIVFKYRTTAASSCTNSHY